MLRIGFSGIPSSGKTTMARKLAAALANDHPVVELVSEYARMYRVKYGEIESIQDQFKILDKQLEWEEEISPSVDVMITDSPIFLGFLYSLDLRNPCSQKDTTWLNDLFRKMCKHNTPIRYDFVFHLPPREAIDDSVRDKRHLTESWRRDSDALMRSIFRIFPAKNFIELGSANLEEVICHLTSSKTVQT